MAATDLCTIDDVYTIGEVNGTARADFFTDAIPEASIAITRYTRRQFYNAGTATYRFEIHSKYVDLDPWDLNASDPVTITLNPESDAPQTLDTPLQYMLEPIGAPWGTYTTIQLSNSYVSWYSTTLINYGFALIDIAGTWGFPDVPDDVKRACVLTILSWSDRAQADYGSGDLIDEPRAVLPAYETAYGIPPGARRLLQPYMRYQVRPG
jgi:hypothetical protein